jgi:hypothetical protein
LVFKKAMKEEALKLKVELRPEWNVDEDEERVHMTQMEEMASKDLLMNEEMLPALMEEMKDEIGIGFMK